MDEMLHLLADQIVDDLVDRGEIESSYQQEDDENASHVIVETRFGRTVRITIMEEE